jgi:uncharacterized protein DUF6794
MKTFVVITFILVVFEAFAGNTTAIGSKGWPKTVDEAAQRLHNRLSPEDLDWIRTNPKNVVTTELHLPYGTSLRNEFGLWGPNRALLKSCKTDDAEECSYIIFSALWEKVRSETDETLSKGLDCEFAALDRVEINTTGWYRLRLGQMLTDLQQQMDSQASSSSGCNGPIKIIVMGDPDLQCFVRVEYEKKDRLGELFQWIGFRNAFSVTHHPPNIILTFTQKCAWPERPKGFTPEGHEG